MFSLVEPRGAQKIHIDNNFVIVRFLSAPWLHQGQHPADWNTLMIGRDLRHIRLAAMADRVLDSAVVLLDQPSPSCGGLALNANPNVNPNDAGSPSVSCAGALWTLQTLRFSIASSCAKHVWLYSKQAAAALEAAQV